MQHQSIRRRPERVERRKRTWFRGQRTVPSLLRMARAVRPARPDAFANAASGMMEPYDLMLRVMGESMKPGQMMLTLML